MKNLILVLVVIFLFSCQKEVTFENREKPQFKIVDARIEPDDFKVAWYNYPRRKRTQELLEAATKAAAAKADKDKDGIPDKSDKCPTQPETFNGYQDDDGCPDVVPPPPPPPVDTNTYVPPPPPTTTLAKVIYLDFDGHVVQNTSWNSSGTINAAYSGLQPHEIDTVFNRFVRAYAKFNVIITLDEAVYLKANPKARMRAIFTETWEWYGRAGGVAFTGSFTWGDNTPCFIFTSLHNYNAKNISDAGIHEVGHTLTLRHQAKYLDGVKIEDYNSGDGVNAPWMGVSYYVPFGSWIVGYNSFGVIQDDVAMIAKILGFK